MIPSYLLKLLEQAESSSLEATEDLDELLSTEDLCNMTIEEVFRVSKVLDDVKLTEFFSQKELLEKGYITEEKYQEYRFERIECVEEI